MLNTETTRIRKSIIKKRRHPIFVNKNSIQGINNIESYDLFSSKDEYFEVLNYFYYT
jgi:hypothetical protein